MKISCDVCDNGEASVFCEADEAALCVACDHRVHHANKLAGKHHRFSLRNPVPEQLPVCDICQERRAFLFCQQDRAILCRECDIPIHKSKALKHNRFLFTGIKLSENSELYSSAEASINSFSDVSNVVPNLTPHDSTNKSKIVKSPESAFISVISQLNMINGSNVSDQLVDVLPNWEVEDFLHPFSPLVFSKSDGDVMPFWDCPDLPSSNNNNESSFSKKNNGDWALQASAEINPVENQQFSNLNMAAFGGQISFKQHKDMTNLKTGNKKWNDDNSFAVPQTKPPQPSSASNKRFRAFR